MVASVRYTEFTNGTGAVVAAGGATVEKGQDYADHVVKRTLAAADVGTSAGQTQHAQGMILAEFKGVTAKNVALEVKRVAGGFTYNFTYLTDARAYPGFSITTANGVSTVRFRDGGAGNGLLAANDIIIARIEVGNS